MKKLVIAFLLVAGGPALAAPVGPWIFGTVGYTTYALDDFNQTVSEMSTASGGVYTFDDVNGGVALGLAFGFMVSPVIGISVGYEWLNGGTSYSDPSSSIEFSMPANTLKATFQYTFLQGKRTLDPYIAASVGWIGAAGNVRSDISGEHKSEYFSGSALLLEGVLGLDYWFTPLIAVGGNVGYRYANISTVEADGNTLMMPNGDEMAFDYSGFIIRAGIKVALGHKTTPTQ